MIEQVFGRLQLLFAQGKALLIGADKVQARVMDDEPLDNLDRVEPYGFSYRPKPGAEVYLAFPSGDRSHGIVVVIGDKRYQMDLEEGEAGLHDDEGNWVYIKRGGVIEVKAATKVLADTPLFETTKDAVIGGNLVVKGQTASNLGYCGEGGGRAKMTSGMDVTNGGIKTDSIESDTPIKDPHRHGETGSITSPPIGGE